MGKYDNYSNRKNISKLQKKLDGLMSKKKQDLYAIDMLRKELETAKLFETCQIFGREDFWKSQNDPNASIMFSDDNRVFMFGDKLIHYDDLVSYAFVENKVTNAETTTHTKGAVSRAIVGGALFGGVGAVVGAATAGSKSDTTYYQTTKGFYLQVFLKDENGYQMYIPGVGMLSDKVPKKWLELGTKLQTIVDKNK